MKKILLTLLLLFAILIPVIAGDFGITVDSMYGMPFNPDSEFDWDNSEYSIKTSLWVNSKLGDNMSLEIEGSYTFNQYRDFFLAFDKIKVSGNFEAKDGKPGTVYASFGRMNFSEFTGKVFSHTGDGFDIKYKLPFMSIAIFGAYTGLLQAPASSINLNLSDLKEQNPPESPLFGPAATPRLIEGLTITFPEIFASQTIVISGIFQQELRSEEVLKSYGDSSINTIHAGIGLSGSIPSSNSFFYALYGYGNTGWYEDNMIAAFMAGGTVNYFIPQFASSRITLEGLYSSGDPDHKDEFYEGNTTGAYDTAFLPLTPSPAGLVFTAQQTNLFYGSLSYSLKPFSSSKSLTLRNLLGLVKGTAFFRSTTGLLSSGEINPNKTGNYLGTEVDLSILARLLSDVGFSLKGGIFFPSDTMEVTTPQIKASVELSLSI